MDDPNARQRLFRILLLVFWSPILLVSVIFMIYLAASYAKRTFISPSWMTVGDIGVSKDALEFRVIPLSRQTPSSEREDILLYGDSWTAGFGVPEGYSFSERIRDHFKGRLAVRIAAKNGGELARQYIAIRGTDAKPRLSVIFFNLNNDYETSMMESPYAAPEEYVVFKPDGTGIQVRPKDDASQGVFKYTSDFSRMNTYFSRPSFIRDSFNNMLFRLGLKEDFLYNVHYFSEYFYSTNGGWKYIKRFNDPQTERCAQDGYRLLSLLFAEVNKQLSGRLLVVLLPPRECFGMDIFRRMYSVAAAEQGIRQDDLDFHQPRNRVTEILKAQGIKYVDVYPAMEQALFDGKDIFISYNDHPNWLGHRVIYEAVIQDIEAIVAQESK